MNGYLRKTLCIFPAAFVLSAGIALCVVASIGSDPTTMLQEGVGRLMGIKVGTANLLFNLIILCIFAFAKREYIGPGSIIIGFCLGPVMNLFIGILSAHINQTGNLPVQIALCALGTLLTAVGLSWYIPLKCGLQPMDMVIVTIQEKARISYGAASIIYNTVVLCLSLVTGEKLGIGTLLCWFVPGPICNRLMPLMNPLRQKITGVQESE